MTAQEVAHGFVDVANESMCRPIRALTEARGYETGQHHLACFGGAGGQHACEIAEKLGIKRIIIHKYSSILSAYGMALAEVVQEAQEPSTETLSDESIPKLRTRIDALKSKVTQGLVAQGIETKAMAYEPYLNLRYHGTETNFMIQEPEDGNYRRALEVEHLRELSFSFPSDHKVVVDDVRMRGIGKSGNVTLDAESMIKELESTTFTEAKGTAKTTVSTTAINTLLWLIHLQAQVFFGQQGFVETDVYRLDEVPAGSTVSGPAMVIDNTQTIVIVPGATAKILSTHVIIDMPEGITKAKADGEVEVVDPIKLSVFSHRYMSIAEQMGRALQKTSLSLNIKERLDFSCAIFGPNGDLVANAPRKY